MSPRSDLAQLSVGQTVANADAPGELGPGVQVIGIKRLANTYFQSQSHTAQGLEGALDARQRGLQAIQRSFPEPSGNGISSQLTQFWQDWSALANNPTGRNSQRAVVRAGAALAASLNRTSGSLTTLSRQTVKNIESTLSTVNSEISQIASLNQGLLATNAGGNSPDGNVGSLEDQRDELVSELSSEVSVRAGYNHDGTVNLYSGSEPLVKGPNLQQLSLSQSGPPYSLVWSADGSTYQPESGRLAGMLEVVDNSVPGCQHNMDQVARSLMGSVNYLMSEGYDPAGNRGGPFFLGTGAGDIEVNPAILRHPDLIAPHASPLPAGFSGTNEDGSVAAKVGELAGSQSVTMLVPAGGWTAGASASSWTGAAATTGTGADVAYNQLVTSVGRATSSATKQLNAQRAVTTNVGSALESAKGIDSGEELMKMATYHNAYEANAKLVTTLGSLLQPIVNMVHG